MFHSMQNWSYMRESSQPVSRLLLSKSNECHDAPLAKVVTDKRHI